MPYIIPSSAITPGTVYQPKSRYILNRIDGAIAAWSTRRLISSAPADIARGRDASTNEEDFTAAELAGSGFTTLAGAGDGFYVTLYDQVGNSNATQSTAASQPKGVDTGTLITDGAVPVMDFDGSDDFLNTGVDDNLIDSASTDFSVFVRAKLESGSQYLLSQAHTLGTYSSDWIIGLNTNNVLFWFRSTTIQGLSNYIDSNYHTFVLTWDLSESSFSGYADGAFLASQTAAGYGAASGADVIIGARGDETTSFFNGNMSDVIIFNRVLSGSEISQLHTALA